MKWLPSQVIQLQSHQVMTSSSCTKSSSCQVIQLHHIIKSSSFQVYTLTPRQAQVFKSLSDHEVASKSRHRVAKSPSHHFIKLHQVIKSSGCTKAPSCKVINSKASSCKSIKAPGHRRTNHAADQVCASCCAARQPVNQQADCPFQSPIKYNHQPYHSQPIEQTPRATLKQPIPDEAPRATLRQSIPIEASRATLACCRM